MEETRRTEEAADRDLFLRVWNRVMPEEGEGCPIVVERNGEDTTCPCQAAAGEQERLGRFASRELEHWQTYRLLSRRGCRGGQMLTAMAGNCRRRAKRLSAALFLLSGVRFWPSEQGGVPMPHAYAAALREMFLAEQGKERDYRAAAEGCRDLSLRDLYLDLAHECAGHAECIRGLVENL